MEIEPAKNKIKREKPNKKWTEEKLKIILNCLQEAPEIEAPTAQIFYKKHIAISAINASWDLIRYKVRHLWAYYKKAIDWWKSTGVGLLESDTGTSSVEGKALQMCPHYHQLQEIFAEKRSATAEYEVLDSKISSIDESSYELFTLCSEDPTEIVENCADECDLVEVVDVDCEVVCDDQSSAKISPTQTPTGSKRAHSLTESVSHKAKGLAAKMKKFGPKSSTAYLAAFLADRTVMFQSKVEWEKEKFEREFILNERKVKLKEEKAKSDMELRKREVDLKVLEIEKDEKMKIRQMEKEERLEKYELELKFKHTGM